MNAKKSEYVCIKDDQLQNQSRKIAKLEARANYKDERIEQIILDQKRMEDKIDDLTEAVSQLKYQSLQDDKDIDKRVTSLESTVKVLQWITTLLFGSGVIWIILNYLH
jgi:chromosome segregation ATPase